MPQTGLEHFSVDLPKERARRQYGDRCGRSRFRRAQRDGCDPAAIPNAENAEATQGKSLKNALAALPASLKTYPLSFETLARAALKCRLDLCQFEFAAPLWHIPRGALKRWRASATQCARSRRKACFQLFPAPRACSMPPGKWRSNWTGCASRLANRLRTIFSVSRRGWRARLERFRSAALSSWTTVTGPLKSVSKPM